MPEDNRHIPEPERIGERLAALLIVGLVLLNYPLLSIFGSSAFFLGIPRLYFYLFAVWSLLIGVTALVQRAKPSRPNQPPETKAPTEP